MRVSLVCLFFGASLVSSSHAGISRSKHDKSGSSKFEKKAVGGGSGISREGALEEDESKFERRVVSRWSNEKRARIAKERAARAKASKSRGRKGCRT